MPALLDLISQYIDSETVRRISNQIGADESSTQKALHAALPMLVGGLSRQAGPKGGAQALAKALARDHDGSLLDNLWGMLDRSRGGGNLQDAASAAPGGLSADRRTTDGEGILKHLLGDKRTAVEMGISRASGLDIRKVSQLLPLLAPIVMSVLGRVMRQRELDAGGLETLLDEERAEIEKDAPEMAQGGLLGFLDADNDNQIADDVARLGASLSRSDLLGSVLGGRQRSRR